MSEATLSKNEEQQIDNIIKRLQNQAQNPSTPQLVPTAPIPPQPSIADSIGKVPGPQALLPEIEKPKNALEQMSLEQLKQLPPVKLNANDAQSFIEMINKNVGKVIDDNKENLQDIEIKNIANERAMREPLPGIVANALDDKDVIVNTTIGPITVRKSKGIDHVIFKLTNCPIYRAIMQEITEIDVIRGMFFEEAAFDLIYQFTHDAKSVYALVKEDYNKYHDEAMKLAFDITVGDKDMLMDAILGINKTANDARVQFEAPEPVSQDGVKKK
jgi:hypothetical protein